MSHQIDTIFDDPKLKNKILSIQIIDDLSLVFVELSKEAKEYTKKQIIKQVNKALSYDVMFHTDKNERALSEALRGRLVEEFGEQISVELLQIVSPRASEDIDIFGRLLLSNGLTAEHVVNAASSFLGDVLKLVPRLHFDFIETDSVPATFLLGQIKHYAPISANSLKSKMVSEGLTVSERHLKNALDGLRKKGLILFQRERGYALTAKGLAALPIMKNRNSSDITRLLWIARNGL